MYKFLLCITFVILLTTNVGSQNLESISQRSPVVVTGLLSTNQILYTGNQSNLQHYNAYYTGNINFDIYGVSVPFTFLYTNRKANYTLPFNQFGLHPSYKWVLAHIGYSTMNFSPYTLSGHLFCGGGVELTPPGGFHVSAMYGRFRKAVPYDTANPQTQPSYRRIGYGLKIGYAKEKNAIDLIIFKAKDDEGSIDTIPQVLSVMPQENTVVSLCGSKSVFDNLTLTGEFATSALTRDMRVEEGPVEKKIVKPALWFMPVRGSTIYRKAIKTNLSYAFNKSSVGVGYERIDPDYTTFGSYYFTNNLENITVNFASSLLDSKISISGNAGLQKDNLDKSQMNSSDRYVGSLNANLVPNERLNLTASYSNFLSYTNVRSTFDYINQTNPYETYDTLNYRQISQNMNLSSSYQLSTNKDKRQLVSLNLTYQISNDHSGTETVEKSQFYNASASYMFNLTPRNLNIATSFNYNHNEVTQAKTYTLGPSVTVSKMLLGKKMRTMLTYAYNTAYLNHSPSGSIMNIRLGGSYVLKKHHNFNLSLLYQMRKTKGADVETKRYNTGTITFGYVYNFGLWQKKNKSNNKTEEQANP